MTEHLAVLNTQGVIVSVNRAWERFAAENSRPGRRANAVGVSYKRVCMAAAGQPGGEEALAAWAGIEAVLSKAQPRLALDVCDSPDQSRWFCMRVYPMLAGRQGVVVVHENVAERERAEATLRQSEERLSLILHGTRDGFWDCDLVRNEVYYCTALLEHARLPGRRTRRRCRSVAAPDPPRRPRACAAGLSSGVGQGE